MIRRGSVLLGFNAAAYILSSRILSNQQEVEHRLTKEKNETPRALQWDFQKY